MAAIFCYATFPFEIIVGKVNGHVQICVLEIKAQVFLLPYISHRFSLVLPLSFQPPLSFYRFHVKPANMSALKTVSD